MLILFISLWVIFGFIGTYILFSLHEYKNDGYIHLDGSDIFAVTYFIFLGGLVTFIFSIISLLFRSVKIKFKIRNFLK